MAHTVMVTGADGFIGSHLTEELVKKGEKVKAFCYYNSFNSCGWIDSLAPEIRSEIEIFMGDIRDPNGVRTAMQGQERVFLWPRSLPSRSATTPRTAMWTPTSKGR